MQRRDFLRFGSLTLAQAAAARVLPAQMPATMQSHNGVPSPEGKADYTLRIAPVTVELSPERILSTIGYNGASPGPVLRMREGKSITVDVINSTDIPELVHWHGLLIPADVDGTEEEATPFVPPQGRRRYQFTPRPAGSRWYHSHAMAYSGSASRVLHRSVRVSPHRLGERSGAIRSGDISRPAGLGAVLHLEHGGHG